MQLKTDNYVLTYDNGTGLASFEVAAVSGLTNIVDDTTPQLGGNLDVNGFAITSVGAGDLVLDADTGAVKVNHKLSLQDQTTPASYNDIYADTIGQGGTGLYTGADEELVSNRTARIYGLIF